MTDMLLRYLWETIRFHLGIYACFGKCAKYPWGQLTGAVIYLIFTHWMDMPYGLLAATVSAIVLFFSMQGRIKQRLYRIGVVLILNAGIGEVIELPRMYLLNDNEPMLWLLAEKMILIFILFFIWFCRKHLVGERWMKVIRLIRKIMPILFGVLVISLYLTVVCLTYSYQLVEWEAFRKTIRIVQPIALSGIWILGMMMLSVRETNHQLSKMQEQERELMIAQKNYYEVLLQKEEDTRKYRHDLENQLFSLTILAQNQEWDKLTDYLKEMLQEINEISNKCYNTGNFILDSLSSYLLSGIEGKTLISVKGKLDGYAVLEERGLSIIYSNLLKNAVEEIERCTSEQEKVIQICFQNGERMTMIEIQNTISDHQIDLKNTKKSDRINHGFGLENVQKEVSRMHGMFETEIRKDTFCAKVILPNQ